MGKYSEAHNVFPFMFALTAMLELVFVKLFLHVASSLKFFFHELQCVEEYKDTTPVQTSKDGLTSIQKLLSPK